MSTVREIKERGRFEMDVGEGLAFALYRQTGSTVAISHTEVPRALEGRGLGGALVKGALEILRASGRKVAPRCPFVAFYIRTHPEYRDLLA